MPEQRVGAQRIVLIRVHTPINKTMSCIGQAWGGRRCGEYRRGAHGEYHRGAHGEYRRGMRGEYRRGGARRRSARVSARDARD